MFKRLVLALIVLVGISTAALPVQTYAGGGGGGNGGGSNDLRLIARMGGNNQLTAKAVYRERQRSGGLQQRFKVEIERATPGTVYPIIINGRTFGTITANRLGRAEIEFHSFTFARIQSGDTITVGPLTGTFQ